MPPEAVTGSELLAPTDPFATETGRPPKTHRLQDSSRNTAQTSVRRQPRARWPFVRSGSYHSRHVGHDVEAATSRHFPMLATKFADPSGIENRDPCEERAYDEWRR
jgi:hypothetical protein